MEIFHIITNMSSDAPAIIFSVTMTDFKLISVIIITKQQDKLIQR